MGKALWYIPSAREYPLVWSWIDKVDFVDKLIVKNYQKDIADEIAMRFFFKHPEYSYMIISTDDVVGSPDHLRMLIKDAETHKFPIISGWCNHRKRYASVSVKPCNVKKLRGVLKLRYYNLITIKSIVLNRYGYPFFRAWFTGMPLTLITRRTLKRVPFRPFRHIKDRFCITKKSKRKGRGVMQDVQFGIDCARKKIPIRIDARIFLLHIFLSRRETARHIKVGRKEASVTFVKAEGEING